jgi:hypothetical protein
MPGTGVPGSKTIHALMNLYTISRDCGFFLKLEDLVFLILMTCLDNTSGRNYTSRISRAQKIL